MKRITYSFFLILTMSLMIVSCGGKKERPLIESVSAFINGNDAIIAFGSARIGEVLNKTNYQQEPKIKALLNEPIGQLSTSINMDSPVFYAVEGPIVDGNPIATYIFAEIKDKTKLKENLEKNGFDIQNAKEFEFVQDGDMNLSFDDKLALIVVKNGVENPKELLAELRSQTQGGLSTGVVANILNKKGDIVLGSNLENLYATSNTDLEELSAEKQKELKEMMKNSFVESEIRFENGEIVMETVNHFSAALKNKLFLRKENGAKVIENLGNGSPRVGVAINVDTKKLNEFLSDYAPNAMMDFSKEIGGTFAMAMMMVNYDISKLIDGRAGALVVGDATQITEGMTPDFNFFVGLAGQGKTFGETLKSAIVDKFKVVNLTNEGISGFSSAEFAGKGIVLSEAAKGFGESSFDLFIDLDGLDMEEFQLDGGAKMVEVIKYIKMSADINGSKLIIKAKDGKENILNQFFKKAMNVFEEELAF